MWPTSNPDELARRLGLPAPTVDPQRTLLEGALRASEGQVQPLVDELLAETSPDLYLEAVYQLGVKVVDTGTKGVVDASLGEFAFPAPAATAGLVRSVWAFIMPLSPSGGVTV